MMAKIKTVRQAYGVTLCIAGKDVAPGTVVTLPQDEAEKIAALFGIVPAVRSQREPVDMPASPVPAPPVPNKVVDTEALMKAVDEAQASYDIAKAALDEPDAGSEELTAFEEAEARLNAAEQAVEDAGSQ